MAMNRQTRRMMGDQPQPERRKPGAPGASERTGPAQYLREVRAELRKVGWPTRSEVVSSTIIVLIAVAVMTSLIFGFDYGFAKLVLFLFD